MTEKQHNLLQRTITGVLFIVVMVGGMMLPDLMVALFAIITGLTMWEYCSLVNDHVEGVSVNRFISTVAGVYFFVAMAGMQVGLVSGFAVFLPYILTIVYLFVAELYLKQPNPVADWAYTMLGQMYIALPYSLLTLVAFQPSDSGNYVNYDVLLPLCLFIFLWMNDTGAYCTGSLIGRHKLFPRISPAKTWEGSIGGGVLVLILSAVIGYFANQGDQAHYLSQWQWVGFGLVVVVFGTWGDLVESLFKRTLGIKDSGKILPGHGGMLDRFDSSLLAIPAAVVYLYLLGMF